MLLVRCGISLSEDVLIFLTEEEPTDDSVASTYYYVPYTRVVPGDETERTVSYYTAELVRDTAV